MQVSSSPNPPDVPIYSVVNKLNKKKKCDLLEEEFMIPCHSKEGKSNLSDLAKLLTDTQHLLGNGGHLRASLTVSVGEPPEDNTSIAGQKISWYERENLRVASKLEKERATGESFKILPGILTLALFFLFSGGFNVAFGSSATPTKLQREEEDSQPAPFSRHQNGSQKASLGIRRSGKDKWYMDDWGCN